MSICWSEPYQMNCSRLSKFLHTRSFISLGTTVGNSLALSLTHTRPSRNYLPPSISLSLSLSTLLSLCHSLFQKFVFHRGLKRRDCLQKQQNDRQTTFYFSLKKKNFKNLGKAICEQTKKVPTTGSR